MGSTEIHEFQLTDLPEDILGIVIDNIPLSAYYVLRCTNKAISVFARTQFKSRLKQKWFYDESSKCIIDEFRDGHLELVKWLVDHRGMTIPDSIVGNVRNNIVPMLEWLKSTGHKFTVYDIPVSHVGYDEFRFILENATRDHTASKHEMAQVYSIAEMSRRLDVIKLALEYESMRDISWGVVVRNFADECDELIKIVNYAIEHQKATPDMVAHAAYRGFFKVVAMLRDVIDIPRETMHKIAKSAVLRNDMDILQWVEDTHGFPDTVADDANTIQMIEHLTIRGYSPTARTFAFNVRRQDAEVITYLIRNKCPMNTTACLAAVHANDLTTLKLLHSMGFPYKFEVQYGCVGRDTIKWMIENNPRGTDIADIVLTDDPELVEWACSAGYLVFDDTCAKKAVEFGCTLVVDHFKCPISIHSLMYDIDCTDVRLVNMYLTKDIPPEDGSYVDDFINICTSSGDVNIIAAVLQNGERLGYHVQFVPEHLRHQYIGPWSAVVVDAVITGVINNGVDIEWVFEKTGCSVIRTDILRVLNRHGMKNTAKWIIKRYIREGNTLDADLLVYAVKPQPAPMIRWMYRMGAPLSAELFKKIVRHEVSLVKWLHIIGCPMPVGMEIVNDTLYWYDKGELKTIPIS